MPKTTIIKATVRTGQGEIEEIVANATREANGVWFDAPGWTYSRLFRTPNTANAFRSWMHEAGAQVRTFSEDELGAEPSHQPTLIGVQQLLQSALACLTDAQSREGQDAATAAHSAAWRVADAGLLLRQLVEAQGTKGCGITEPTGRGALLPGRAA